MPVFKKKTKPKSGDVWARPGMLVTFRAEIMPNISREKRTFRVESVTATGRVRLENMPNEYNEGSFEPITFRRQQP